MGEPSHISLPPSYGRYPVIRFSKRLRHGVQPPVVFFTHTQRVTPRKTSCRAVPLYLLTFCVSLLLLPFFSFPSGNGYFVSFPTFLPSEWGFAIQPPFRDDLYDDSRNKQKEASGRRLRSCRSLMEHTLDTVLPGTKRYRVRSLDFLSSTEPLHHVAELIFIT